MIEHAIAAAVEPVPSLWVAAIPLLPLFGAILLGLAGERLQRQLGKDFVGSIAVATVGGSFLFALSYFFKLVAMDEHARAGGFLADLLPWIHVGGIL